MTTLGIEGASVLASNVLQLALSDLQSTQWISLLSPSAAIAAASLAWLRMRRSANSIDDSSRAMLIAIVYALGSFSIINNLLRMAGMPGSLVLEVFAMFGALLGIPLVVMATSQSSNRTITEAASGVIFTSIFALCLLVVNPPLD